MKVLGIFQVAPSSLGSGLLVRDPGTRLLLCRLLIETALWADRVSPSRRVGWYLAVAAGIEGHEQGGGVTHDVQRERHLQGP